MRKHNAKGFWKPTVFENSKRLPYRTVNSIGVTMACDSGL
jgi:hypothetical protein